MSTESIRVEVIEFPPMQVEDKVMSREDVLGMDKQQMDEMFTILDFCYDPDTHKYKVTRETILALEQYQDSSNLLKDVLRRINRYSTDADFNPKSFYMRMNTVLRVVKLAVTKQPDILSPLTVSRVRLKPEYKWVDVLYDGNGGPRQNALVPDVSVLPEGNPLSAAQVDMAGALSQVANVYKMIAGSITYEEILKLKTMDKINALKSLSYIHSSVGKFRGSVKFTKINITKGSKEELESAMLDFDDE